MIPFNAVNINKAVEKRPAVIALKATEMCIAILQHPLSYDFLDEKRLVFSEEHGLKNAITVALPTVPINLVVDR